MERISAILLFILLFLAISFTKQKKWQPIFHHQKDYLEQVGDYYSRGIDDVIHSLETLQADLKLFESNSLDNEMKLRSSFLIAKVNYKKIEFLVDYLEPEMCQKYINGAPLPKVDPHVAEIVILEPRGFQRLEELIFDDPVSSLIEIHDIIYELCYYLNVARKSADNTTWQHRYVIEALRYGIIRVFTLGLTAFDTPASDNALQESKASWKAMNEIWQGYETMDLGIRRNYSKRISKLFDMGDLYFEEYNDFDEFPRLDFLVEVFRPLYAALYRFHKSSGIELQHEVDPTLSATNYGDTTFFSENLFNPAFFTRIANSDLLDDKKVDLGKRLFFDPILSRNLDMSCATCHNPKKGFADGIPKSASSEDGVFLNRNSISLLNASIYGNFFWDMREYNLERQIKHVAHSKIEFDLDFLEMSARLKQSETYVELFENAYGERDQYGISGWSISNSLAAYVHSLTQFNSPFDQYVRGEDVELSEEIKRGFDLFMGKAACGTCHFAPSFSGLVPPYYRDSESEVLGVLTEWDTINPRLDGDLGRSANGRPKDGVSHFENSMKTVTVRNAALTAPYMHNGFLSNLGDVIEFYNLGGGGGMGLEIPNQTLPPDRLNLTGEEKQSLKAFIESLTDELNPAVYELPELPSFPINSPFVDRKILAY